MLVKKVIINTGFFFMFKKKFGDKRKFDLRRRNTNTRV